MRVIILADGPSTRWDSHVPKHLISLNGEVLLHRTVRQLSSKGITDIWITSHNQDYEVAGATRFEPKDNLFQVDQFYACSSLWLHHPHSPIIFLYGDVYFSDAAIDSIVSSTPTAYLYFQRTEPSQITGKNWKEGFAMSVADKDMFYTALSTLRQGLAQGTIKDEHHQMQGYLEGFGTGPYWGIGQHGIEIDDETDDFDSPDDVQMWIDHVAEYNKKQFALVDVPPSQERRNFTPDFWRELSAKLPGSPVVFDLGAHAMEEASALIPLLSGRPSWHSFEANLECCHNIRTNLLPSLRTMADVSLNEVAVSSCKGSATLYRSGKKDNQPWTASSSIRVPKRALDYYPWMSFDGGITVPTITLDDYCREYHITLIDLLKMDIQGAEIDAIRGGSWTFSHTKYVITEVCEGEEYVGQMGLAGLVAAMPGKWIVVERLLYDALLLNTTYPF